MRGGRPAQLEVRLVHRAPLPRGVLAHLRQRGADAVGARAHRPDPRRQRHHQRDAAGQPPGSRRRAGRDDGSRVGRSLRVRHRPRLVHHGDGRLRDHRPRDHAGDVRRGDRRVQAHVGRRQVLVRRQVLLHAVAQRVAEALREAASADVGRGRQPRDVREGRARGFGRAVLHRRFAAEDGAVDRVLQEGHRQRRPGGRVRERQRRRHHELHVPRRP